MFFNYLEYFFQCWLSLWNPKPSDGTTSPTLKPKSSRGSSWREEDLWTASSKARCHSSSWWIQLEDFELPWQQRALNMWKQSWGYTKSGRVESEYTCVCHLLCKTTQSGRVEIEFTYVCHLLCGATQTGRVELEFSCVCELLWGTTQTGRVELDLRSFVNCFHYFCENVSQIYM